jgi:hypothetical protein
MPIIGMIIDALGQTLLQPLVTADSDLILMPTHFTEDTRFLFSGLRVFSFLPLFLSLVGSWICKAIPLISLYSLRFPLFFAFLFYFIFLVGLAASTGRDDWPFFFLSLRLCHVR